MYQRFQFWRWYFPFRINFLILVVISIIIYVTQKSIGKLQSEFQPLIFTMCKVSVILLFIIIFVSFVSVLFSLIYFKRQCIKNTNNLKLSYSNGSTIETKTSSLQFNISIAKFILPIWGFLKVILFFDNTNRSIYFNIASAENRNGFIVNSLNYSAPLDLHHIKTYSIDKGIIFFQDFFRLFSLPYFVRQQDIFWNLPTVKEGIEPNVSAMKSEDNIVKTEKLKRVDGELLHYKNYSPSDDTRRIVWKIFAKNKQLVVRIPEVLNPFANHIVFLPSFSNIFINPINKPYNDEMLNYYKQNVFNIYTAIKQKQYEVKYSTDQEVLLLKDIAKIITVSEWHNNNFIQDLPHLQKNSVIVMSSASSNEDFAHILNSVSENTRIYFVRLSVVLQQSVAKNILERLFLHLPKDEYSKLKSHWIWHPYKRQLQQNENQAIELISKFNNVIVI
jgi:hypothetical protein